MSMKDNSLFFKTRCLLPLVSVILSLTSSASGQVRIPMDASHWDTSAQKADFFTYKGVKAMKILNADKQVTLKGLQFSNGTIEFDVEPTDVANSPFVSFYFRRESADDNECVYLRMGKPHPEKRNDAVQYAPFMHGINLWDMLGHYQGPAIIFTKDWNHVKLVVSGLQMKVYINQVKQPTLEIPYLEGNVKKGAIAFDGQAIFANVVVKPDVTEGLSASAGADLTNHDANYIRRWSVSKPTLLKEGYDLTEADLPKDTAGWLPIKAERRGLINVTRNYGVVTDQKRLVWLKTIIRSSKDQSVNLQLGFSDDVWVFINKELLYLDKNTYLGPMRKNPDGRCDILNTSFLLPLKEGDNQVVIGLANNFYGWGLIARLESLENIELVSDEPGSK